MLIFTLLGVWGQNPKCEKFHTFFFYFKGFLYQEYRARPHHRAEHHPELVEDVEIGDVRVILHHTPVYHSEHNWSKPFFFLLILLSFLLSLSPACSPLSGRWCWAWWRASNVASDCRTPWIPDKIYRNKIQFHEVWFWGRNIFIDLRSDGGMSDLWTGCEGVTCRGVLHPPALLQEERAQPPRW